MILICCDGGGGVRDWVKRDVRGGPRHGDGSELRDIRGEMVGTNFCISCSRIGSAGGT